MNDFFNQFKANKIEFMSGENVKRGTVKELATANDEPLNVFTVKDYAFLNGDNGVYAVFCLNEIDNVFYFGNAQITNVLTQIDQAGMRDEFLNGVKVYFVKGVSKKFNNEYVVMNVL